MINGKTIPRPSQKISWIYHNSLGDLQINTLHGDRIAAQHLIWTSCGRRPGYQNSQIQMMQLWGNRRCHKSRLLLQTTSVKTSPAARFHGYANFASWAAHGSFTKVRSPVWRGRSHTRTHTHTQRKKSADLQQQNWKPTVWVGNFPTTSVIEEYPLFCRHSITSSA